MAITAAELLVRVGADTSDAESGLKSFSSKMKGIGGQMAAVGGVLSATVAAPLIGIAVSAVKTAADFEKSMNVLGYASGATAKQMQALSDQALQLGADTVFSANEAAEGMVELSKAGMDVTDVMDAIPGVMDLAAAGQISVSEAATLAAATVNTFGLEASKTTEVADVLAAAANASAADISDLAFGVQNAGSIFATSGQSVETLATMMALLANNGLNASDAATSLKTMTMRLTAPTAAAAKVMNKLGIAVFNADGSMRDYHDIVGDIERATIGLSDAQRATAFTTIFGADAIRAANILAAEGTAGYEAMATAVGEQGAAAAMANAQNSGLAGTIEQITGSLSSLATKLALPFLDDISAMGNQITTFVNQIGELPQPVINAALAFGGFAVALAVTMAAIGGAALLLAPLGGTVGLVALALLGLGLAVAALWAAWETNFGNIQDKTSEALGVVNPLLATLSGYLTTASTSLSSAAASLGVLLAFNPQFASFMTNVNAAATAVGAFGSEAAKAFDNFKMPNTSTLKTNVEMQLIASVQNLKLDWSQLKIDTSDFVTKVGDEISAISWTDLAVDFGNLFTQISKQLATAADSVFGKDNLISKEIGRVQKTFDKISTSMQGVDISDPLSVLNTGLSAAIDIVGLIHGIKTDTVVEAGTTLETLVTQILSVATSLTTGIDTTLITKTTTDMVTAISDAVVALTDPANLGALGTAAGGLASTLVTKLGDALGAPGFGEDIGAAVGKATVAIASGATAFATKFADQLAATPWEQFGGQIQTFIGGFVSAFFSQIGPALLKASIFNPETRKAAEEQGPLKDVPQWMQKIGRGDFAQRQGAGITFQDLDPTKVGQEIAAAFNAAVAGGFHSPLWVKDLLAWKPTLPPWMEEMKNWKIATPSWLTKLTTWVAESPKWLAGMIDWVAKVPTWLPGMLDWLAKTPTWLAGMLDWHALTPLWLDDLLGWIPSTPGWVERLLGWSPGVFSGGSLQDQPQHFNPNDPRPQGAGGFSNFRGGMAWVGEEGPELVNLPRGSNLYPHDESMAMAGGITINVNVASINNGMDIEQLAAQLARRFQQKLRL